MARAKAKELPSNIAHLPKYVAPTADRVRHDDLWLRAHARWKPGTKAFVRFD